MFKTYCIDNNIDVNENIFIIEALTNTKVTLCDKLDLPEKTLSILVNYQNHNIIANLDVKDIIDVKSELQSLTQRYNCQSNKLLIFRLEKLQKYKADKENSKEKLINMQNKGGK